MSEAHLTIDLKRTIKETLPGSHVQKFIGNAYQRDVPDLAVAWHVVTSWYEIKLDTDDKPLDSTETQALNCLRLGAAGLCHYVIYEERRGIRRTVLVHPRYFDDWRRTTHAEMCVGWKHAWVAEQIRQLHGG